MVLKLFSQLISITLISFLLNSFFFSSQSSELTGSTLNPSQSIVNSTAQMSFTGAARKVGRVVKAIEQSEGAGARVRRSIGTQQLRNFSPFLMLDHFRVPEGAGFPE